MTGLRRNWRDKRGPQRGSRAGDPERDPERGMTLIMVGLGFLAFMSATMLAVDVGMLMVARTQSQTAADAGALAGAVALVFDNFDDRSAGGPAVQNAITASTSTVNQVVNTPVSVNAGDVTFPTVERVRVEVRRTEARGNPMLTFIAPMVGIDHVDVGAVATAEAVPANAATCVKPWAVPDKWLEKQFPDWDENDDLNMFYETGPNKGNPLPNPDIYIGADDEENYTGFRPSPQGPDYGRQILLKPGSPADAINASQFFPIRLPGGQGSDYYGENISSCWPGVLETSNMVEVETGNQTGKTVSEVEKLIAKDPYATWADNKVNSTFHPSPRIVVIPVFDPYEYEQSRQHGLMELKVANLVGFFIEDMVGNSVLGRIVPMTGLIRSNGGGPAPAGSFLKAIRLVE